MKSAISEAFSFILSHAPVIAGTASSAMNVFAVLNLSLRKPEAVSAAACTFGAISSHLSRIAGTASLRTKSFASVNFSDMNPDAVSIAFLTGSGTAFQMSSQLVPNHPRNVFVVSVSQSTAPPNTPLIFSQALLQSPSKIAVNVSTSPRIPSRAAPTVESISLNASSNTGTRKSHRLCHAVRITSPISSKLNPSLFSRSVMF